MCVCVHGVCICADAHCKLILHSHEAVSISHVSVRGAGM